MDNLTIAKFVIVGIVAFAAVLTLWLLMPETGLQASKRQS